MALGRLLPLICALLSTQLVSGAPDNATEVTVAVAMEPGFVSLGEAGHYEGFVVSVLRALEPALGVVFKLRDAGDASGVLEKLKAEEAEVGAGALSIHASSDVDFSKPFINSGISMVVARPDTRAAAYRARLFAYLRPLSAAAWVVCLLCTAGTGVFLYLLLRFHPKEAAGSDGAAREAWRREGSRLGNSFWLIARSFALQGIEKRPKSIASRIVVIVWIFFILDSILIYLAALIHNFPVYYAAPTNPELPFAKVSDLSLAQSYSFGAVQGSAVENFFRSSSVQVFKAIGESMETVESTDEGIARVKSSKFVFLTDSAVATYRTNTDCDIIQMGSLINPTGFGFAVKKNATLRDTLSMSILSLVEDGTVHELWMKWTKDDVKCEEYVPAEVPADQPEEVQVGMDGYGGPVVLLVLGMLLALLVAIVEVVVLKRRTKSYDVEEADVEEKAPMLEQEEAAGVKYEEDPKSQEQEEEVEMEKKEEEAKKEEEEKKEEDEDVKPVVEEEVKAAPEEEKKEDGEEKKEEEVVEEKKDDETEKEETKEEEKKEDLNTSEVV